MSILDQAIYTGPIKKSPAIYRGVVIYFHKGARRAGLDTGKNKIFYTKPYDKPGKAKARATYFSNWDINQREFEVVEKFVEVADEWKRYDGTD